MLISLIGQMIDKRNGVIFQVTYKKYKGKEKLFW
jgi:hypothetical protein